MGAFAGHGSIISASAMISDTETPETDGGKARRTEEDDAKRGLDDSFKSRLRQLDARISTVRRSHDVPETDGNRGSALGLAFRLAVELVAGLVVGGGIGWFLDKWLGTLPIMLLLFFALGAAAGILNVIRTAKQMQDGLVARQSEQDTGNGAG
jgi:ATP synthase protein I